MNPTLCRLAWASWLVGGGAVALASDDDPSAIQDAIAAGVLLHVDGGMKFVANKTMVHAAADYMLHCERTKLSAAPRECFDHLHEAWSKEIGAEESVAGLVLSRLHQNPQIEVFDWARQAIEAGANVFHVTRVLEAAIPHLVNVSAQAIREFFLAGSERQQSDLFGGIICLKLQPWLSQHPKVAGELVSLHEAAPVASSSGLYGVALHALVSSDFMSGYEKLATAAKSPHLLITKPALKVLGFIEYELPACAAALERTTAILADIIADPDHALTPVALMSAGQLVDLNETAFVSLLEQGAATRHPETLFAVSTFMAMERQDCWDRPWFWPLFMQLSRVQAVHKGTLDNVDSLLSGWLVKPNGGSKVLEFLSSWIANQTDEMPADPGMAQVFDSTIYRLAETPAFCTLITTYLLHPDQRYPITARSAISKLRAARTTNFSLDPDVLDRLSPDEFIFLARRMLGYLSGDEVILPLVFSLLHTQHAQERTFGLFVGLVRDRLSYDHPEETLEFLKEKEKAESDPARKDLYSSLSQEIEMRHAEERALPTLKEFYPSPDKARRFSKERRRQMAEAFEKAEQASVLRDLFMDVQLKAGRSTFCKFQNTYSDVMRLKAISQRIPIPHSEITDPMGSARERYLFRQAKKGDK